MFGALQELLGNILPDRGIRRLQMKSMIGACWRGARNRDGKQGRRRESRTEGGGDARARPPSLSTGKMEDAGTRSVSRACRRCPATVCSDHAGEPVRR
jgi:hypothetical protein